MRHSVCHVAVSPTIVLDGMLYTDSIMACCIPIVLWHVVYR